MIVPKGYRESTIYVTIMLVIFILSFINSMNILSSSFYGFTIGSGIYFGFQYGYTKLKKDSIEKN